MLSHPHWLYQPFSFFSPPPTPGLSSFSSPAPPHLCVYIDFLHFASNICWLKNIWNISNKSRKCYPHSTHPRLSVNILKCFLPIFTLVFLSSKTKQYVFALFLLLSNDWQPSEKEVSEWGNVNVRRVVFVSPLCYWYALWCWACHTLPGFQLSHLYNGVLN